MNFAQLFPLLLSLVSRGGDVARIVTKAMELLVDLQTFLPAASNSKPDVSTMRGIQEALELLGYSPGPIDGELGSRTKYAVKTFQTAWNLAHPSIPLEVDGWPGSKTQAALVEAMRIIL